MDGVRLAALFSCIPNKFGYCGPKDTGNLFFNYLKNNKDGDKVKQALVKFEALYPYLNIIAKKNNKNPFDFDVVESYWLGNKLSELDKQDVVELIEMLAQRGLMDSIAKGLIKKIEGLDEEKLPLTHLFHVLFVGVGAVTGSVPNIIKNMDKCRISWGTVCEITDLYLIVEYNRLKQQGRKYFIDKNIEKIKVYYSKIFFDDIKIKDVVAIHWESAVKKLGSEELNNLKVYTQKVIGLISKL